MDKNCDKDDPHNSLLNQCVDPSEEHFDPLRALYSEDLKAKGKNYAIYDNLAMFESALQKLGISQVGTKSLRKENEIKQKSFDTTTKIKRRFLPHQMPVKGTIAKPRHSRNLLKQMDSFKGPLGGLTKMLTKTIKIYTRTEHGVRGYTIGCLVAFDKHWNVLVTNAYEVWKRRKFKFSTNGANLNAPQNCSDRLNNLKINLLGTEIKSLDRKNVQIKRKCNQIMIRGEQIVLIMLLPEDNQANIIYGKKNVQ